MVKDCKEQEEIRVVPFEVEMKTDEPSEYIPNGVRMIQAPEGWGEANEGEGTVVAILDTGIDVNHPDLKDNIIDGINFTNDYRGDRTNFDDNNGHGTHVAGTIGAVKNNVGIVGVAPRTKFLVVKVLGGDGGGLYDWIIKGIRYACDWRGKNGEKVSVMNLSLGGPYDVPALEEAVKYAVNECHIPIVCATGNSGTGLGKDEPFRYDFPASYNEVISVTAIDKNLELAQFANVNDEIDCVALGVDVLSTYPKSSYAHLSGTSMAAPHVAGALALLKVYQEREFGREFTEAELYAQLIKRTIPLEYPAHAVGNGLVKLKYMSKYRGLIDYIQTNFGE